ncbi:MAG: LysR family transcriptional regulator [Mobilitalea sp.]
MNTASIRYFISVVECLNFSEAAEKNFISQSSLSKAIISMEKELQVTLFDRSRHPIIITPAGKVFYERIKQIEPLYMQTLQELSNYSENKTIRCYAAPKSYAFRNAINVFSIKNPDIKIVSEFSADFGSVVDAVMNKGFDLAITHRPLCVPNQLKVTPLYDDELYVIVSTENRLSKYSSIPLSELEGQTFIESPYSRTILLALSETFHFQPHMILPKEGETITREEGVHKVSFNQGISIYCRRDISVFKPNKFVVLKLEEVPSFPVVILDKREKNYTEGQRCFIQYLKENLETFVGKMEN